MVTVNWTLRQWQAAVRVLVSGLSGDAMVVVRSMGWMMVFYKYKKGGGG